MAKTRSAVPKRVSSYDRDAPTPEIGSRWIWERYKPWAREAVTVTDVKWNGEEWWVEAVIDPCGHNSVFPLLGKRYWNDLSRFWEAVTPVPQSKHS